MCNGLVVVVVSVAAEHLQFFFYSVIRSRPVVPVTPSGRHGELSAQSIGRFAAAQRVTIPRGGGAVVVCSHQRRGLVVGVRIYVQAKG